MTETPDRPDELASMPAGAPAPSWQSTITRAAIAAIPYVGGPLEILVSDIRARQSAKAAELVGSIAVAVGEEELIRRLATDERAEMIFVNAVNAALRTGHREKRRLLARVAAQALGDDARMDESELLVATLNELESPHIVALARLEAEWVEAQQTSTNEAQWGASPVWQGLSQPIKAVLVRVGVARPSPQVFHAMAGPHRAEGITDFGLDLLRMLRAEA